MKSPAPPSPTPPVPPTGSSATPWDENDFSAYRSTVHKERWLLRGLILFVVWWWFGVFGVLLGFAALFVVARWGDRLAADQRRAVPPVPTHADYRKSGWWGPWARMPWWFW